MIPDSEKRRLFYQCRRGMLELDVILQPFFTARAGQMDASELQRFARLLEEADPDLYTWLMGYGEPSSSELRQMVDIIRAYARPGRFSGEV